MKNIIRRAHIAAAAGLLAFSVFFAASPAKAQAATKTVKTMALKKKNGTIVTTTAQADKKAFTVKKGSFSLKYKSGILKFKAPKKATYTFTFSALKDPAKYNFSEIVFLKKGNKSRLTETDVTSPKKNKGDTLLLSTKEFAKRASSDTDMAGVKVTGKIKLKKNEILYIYIHPAVEATVTMKLNIK